MQMLNVAGQTGVELVLRDTRTGELFHDGWKMITAIKVMQIAQTIATAKQQCKHSILSPASETFTLLTAMLH